MLRASATATEQEVDPRAVTDRTIDPAIRGGAELLDLVDVVLLGKGDLGAAQAGVIEVLGPEGLVDAAGVIGNFEMMNRIADGTGMPVGKGSLARTADLRAELGLDRFRHSG
jgi:hypothetical protein